MLIFASELVKSLVRQERNQQLMCEAGMVHTLLTIGEAALADERHPLGPCLQYILERLAAQSLRPRELRYLRCVQSIYNAFYHSFLIVFGRNLLRLRFMALGGQLPLSRIKTLVSMITLRDRQSVCPPSFVEFDLSYEGFGGLYLPSIAPQNIPAFALHGNLPATDSTGTRLSSLVSG